jgi:hypothetical protein
MQDRKCESGISFARQSMLEKPVTAGPTLTTPISGIIETEISGSETTNSRKP